MELKYKVTGEKLLPDGNIEKTTSVYSYKQFMNAQAMMARLLLDDGYIKAQIKVISPPKP